MIMISRKWECKVHVYLGNAHDFETYVCLSLTVYNLRIYIKLPIRRVTSEPKLPKSLYTIILFNTYCFVQNFNLSIQASDPRIILFRNNIYLWQTSVKTLTPVKSDRIVCYFYHGNGGVIQDGKSLFRIHKISGKANSFSYNCILKFFISHRYIRRMLWKRSS